MGKDKRRLVFIEPNFERSKNVFVSSPSIINDGDGDSGNDLFPTGGRFLNKFGIKIAYVKLH